MKIKEIIVGNMYRKKNSKFQRNKLAPCRAGFTWRVHPTATGGVESREQ